jgi:hypothetical protein
MDTTKLVVGQEVLLFGIGFLDGKVVSVVPSIAVQTNDGLLQFDEDGRETDACRYIRLGGVLSSPWRNDSECASEDEMCGKEKWGRSAGQPGE